MDLAREPPAGRCCLAAALAVAAAGCTAARPAGRPAATAAGERRSRPALDHRPRATYLQGRPLAGPTGLRLLVASDPPRLLDVDRGTSRRVGGVPAGQDPFSVTPLGDGAIVTADREVFVLPRGSAPGDPGRPGRQRHGVAGRAQRLAAPAGDGAARCGRSAWTDGPAGRPCGCPAAPACSPTPRSACSSGPSRPPAARSSRSSTRAPAGSWPATPRSRGRGRPGPLGRPRARRRPVHPDRPAHRGPPPGGPPHPPRPGRPRPGSAPTAGCWPSSSPTCPGPA